MAGASLSKRVAPLLVAALALSACGGGGGGKKTDTAATDSTVPLITVPETTAFVDATTTTVGVQTYTIVKGDSLSKIAARFGVKTADLAAFNGITDPNKIQAGQVLKIPPPGVSTPPTSTGGGAGTSTGGGGATTIFGLPNTTLGPPTTAPILGATTTKPTATTKPAATTVHATTTTKAPATTTKP